MIDISSRFNNLGRKARARTTPALSPTALGILLCLLFCADLAAQAGYTGPSLLSRGGNRPGRRGRAPVDFSFYLGLRGTSESGLIAPNVGADGVADPLTAYGGSAEAGLYGGHDWRRSSLGVDYRGDYRKNTRGQGFNGFNQALSLEYQNRLSNRTTIMLRETAGTSNRAFGGFAAPAFSDIGQYGVPLNEVYDVRTDYMQTSASIAYRKSARITLVGQGSAFVVKRRNNSLINGQGYTGGGVASYRTSRSTEVGLIYQFIRFEFPRVYSGSDAQSLGIHMNKRINRNWEADLTGGVYRIDSFGTQVVTLSPEVAFILGRTTSISAFQRVVYRPLIDATISYAQDRGRFHGTFTSAIGNGNGVYLTTQNTALHTGYSYAGIRRMSIGLSAGYTRTGSVSIAIANLSTYRGGVGITYRLAEHLDFTSQVDYRKFDAPGVRGREGAAVIIGLSYASSQLPISIW